MPSSTKKVASVTALGTLILVTAGVMFYQFTDIGKFLRKRTYVTPKANELGLFTSDESRLAYEEITPESNAFDDLPLFELPNGITSTISNKTLLQVWQKNRQSVPKLLAAFRRSKHFYPVKGMHKDVPLWKCATYAALNKAIQDKDLATTKDLIEQLKFVERNSTTSPPGIVDGFIGLAAIKKWEDPQWQAFADESARNNPVKLDVVDYLKFKHLQVQTFSKNTDASNLNPALYVPLAREAIQTAISEFYITMSTQ